MNIIAMFYANFRNSIQNIVCGTMNERVLISLKTFGMFVSVHFCSQCIYIKINYQHFGRILTQK